MANLNHLQNWQRDNVERAMNEAVREALFYGLNAGDMKRLLASCWESELRERAELGASEILATP